ncbi:hypothetical protein DK847_04895 [Aestuariivirga litoralis]|uniref:DUF2336 domain-containing protein n=1 Tax=Aestuariivirga litoralis TaxID=2650924 RepID=A0A2W2AQW8_9HYPH|nr:DUF2336 domain-containing protein [Aestuariivirga litoralis]PZF77771.1 hypothetical protein DK847_04895 [Aestuariivirga litoralis]
MQPEAPILEGEPSPRRGTVQSFRLLTARLRRASPGTMPEGPGEPESPLAGPAPAPPPPATPPPPADAGDAAVALLDIMWGAVDLPPQERSLAGDTLLLLLPRLSHRSLVTLAERIAAMDSPPALLVSRLVRDPRPDVGGVVLERSAHVAEGDLLASCHGGAGPERLRLLAKRRSVSSALADHIVASGDLLSLLALLRNPGAELSFQAFLGISRLAGEHPGLQAPLAMRTDLPLAVALDLFWRLPPELRRVITARFLSDSVTLGRILSIGTAATQAPALPEGPVSAADFDAALGPLFTGKRDLTVRRLAGLAGAEVETVERIFADAEGEALVVLLKALGLSRARFDEALDRIRTGTGLLREDRPQAELKAVFDALSFSKARVLLIYWDWFARRAGPYVQPA